MNTHLKVLASHSNKRSGQRGLSLIELMIAMTIGLFLLSGIATTYITSVKANSNQDQSSMLEDNARLALEVLTKSLEHTGYVSEKGIPLSKRFLKKRSEIVVESCGGAGGTSSKNVLSKTIFPSNATKDKSGGDRVTSTYYGDDRLFTDCSGGILPAGCRLGMDTTEAAKIYNSFYLDKATNSLMCAGSRDASAQVVAEGIENIQYLYGVDIGDDLIVDRYIKADDLFATSPSLIDKVISIQVAILVRSLLPVKTIKEKKTYTLLDQTYTPAEADRYQREVFSTTIRLRNTL
ncbi:MAG: PilW family protein [Cocleimonas sp.]